MKWLWKERIIEDGYGYVAVFSDGHKVSFLTYEEADAALKKEDDENEK